MCSRRFSKLFLSFIILSLFISAKASAETYTEAVTNAQNNIDNNTNFIPGATDKAIVLIPQSGSTDFGLTYQNYSGTDYLITRTFTKTRNVFNSSTQTLTGVGDTTIFGGATTDAAWLTTGNDATKFLDANSATASTVTDIYERGLGMDNNGSHNAIVEYAVLPNNDNIMRPGRKPDITQYSTTSSDYSFSANFDNTTKPDDMSATTFTNLKTYLTGWQDDALGTLDSKGDPTWHNVRPQTGHESWSKFPWTQLGYTYFWNSGGTDLAHIQGMTEFIALGGTAVKVVGIYSPQSYLYTKNKSGAFSSDTDAQYGNGFASFNVTGNCDTIWAGNTFQKNVSASSASGSENTITIGTGSTVSGGQGILVSSVNYKVTNNGTISGSTLNKLYYNASYPGMTGTANIAVLFKGGSDAAGGSNQLINTGTISSPGTAIKVEAGNTTITSSGTIYGTNYAIQSSATTAGTDSVNITGGAVTGSIDLGGGNDTLNVSGTSSNVTLGFFLDRDTRTSSQVVNAENVTFTDNKVTVAVNEATGSNNFRDNDSFLIVDATTLSADTSKITVQDDLDMPMLTFSLSKSGNQLSLLAQRDDTYYQQNSSNSSLGAVLDNLANTGSNDMSEIIGALDDSGSATNVKKLEPEAAAPIVNTTIQTLNNFGNAFSMQMARLGNDRELEVYAEANGKKKRIPASALDNMLVYNSDSILENSFNRPENWEVFATGFGMIGHQSDRDNAVGYNSAGGGTQIGFYRRFNDELMLGALGGYMFDNVELNQNSGAQNINSVRIGPCAKWLRNNLYATGAVTYGYHGVQANRKIQIGVIDRQADADYSMYDISPFIEAGYIFRPKKNLEIVPNISLQYDWLHSQSYNESGAGSANLDVDAFNSNSLVSVIGVRLNGRIDLKSATLLPEFNFGWQHEYLGRIGNIDADFSSESSGTFTTHPSAFDRNALRAGVAANFIYGKKHNSISLQYNAEIYDSASNHVFGITCRNYF